MPRDWRIISEGDSLKLLGEVPLGRVVFTHNALPAIRPVNHIVADGDVIIRTHDGADIVKAADGPQGVVVVYEADQIDPYRSAGWSVVVTGRATLVSDPQEIARYQHSLPRWVNREMDNVVRITPEIVSGFRLV